MLSDVRPLPVPARPRPDGRGGVCLRCADFGEHRDCLTLIHGGDAAHFLESLRVHLRDAHGVTPAGFLTRRNAIVGPLLSSLEEVRTKER
jgi:hypothetical protein